MIRALAAITLAAAAACGGSSPPPTTIEGHATGPAAPATAPPSVTWIDNGFDTPRLPAVARDGSRVVLPEHLEDGGRGAPNLAIVVKDRNDAEVGRLSVLAVDEVDAMFDEHGVTPALRERIAAANRHLASLHAQHDLVWLTNLDMPTDVPLEERLRASSPDLVVEWKNGHLTIQSAGRKVVDLPTPASWLHKDHPMCPTCSETCSNPAFLGGVAADAERKLAVITVSYTGTDTCWEPSSQQHVVAW